jgi:diaminopimelate epimerase
MTRALKFTKGHESGNDFVLICDPESELDLSPKDYAFLADRRVGAGGEGVIRAVKTAHMPEWSHLLDGDPDAEWFMDSRNSDGTDADLSANGLRVYLAYLLAEGLVSLKQGDRIAISTRAGVKDVQLGANGMFRVDLGRWSMGDGTVAPVETDISARGLDVPRPALGISVGNPHAVVALANADELVALDLTVDPVLEPRFKPGVTVEFVVPADPLVDDGIGRISMRVHERGVGETLSSGTGAAAAALATRHWAGPNAPHNWRVEMPGGTLGIQMFPTEEGEHVSLSGPAELVYSGIIAV